MAATEGSTSNLPEESNCDGAIQDGKKSVRDIKFMFDKPTVAPKPKSVVFHSMRKARESSTDTMDKNIRKMKSLFETSNVPENSTENTEGVCAESRTVLDSVAQDSTVETKESNGIKSPVRDSVDMRASTVITASFSFLPTFDDEEEPSGTQGEGDIVEVQESKETTNMEIENDEGEFLSVHGNKEVPVEAQETKEMKIEAQDKHVQDNTEAHNQAQDKNEQDSQEKETDKREVITEEIHEAQAKDETESEAQEINIDAKADEAQEAQTEALETEQRCKEDTDKENTGIQISPANKITVEKHNEKPGVECSGNSTVIGASINADEEVTNVVVKKDKPEILSKPTRKSERFRASEFITDSFSFLPQDDDDYLNDDYGDAPGSTKAQTLESSVDKAENSVVSSSQNDAESVDPSVEGIVPNCNDFREPRESVESTCSEAVSRSSSQSSTDSAVLRSAEKREIIHKVTRQASRKGFISEVGSNLDQRLTTAIRNDQLRRNSDQDTEFEISTSRNSTGSSESPRLRPKVERSLSSGSYDGSRTLERLRSRSRSRSNSPGVSDGSDDDEDDDEGIYAETFRYSSYIFVGDDDSSEMSFSASTPDFSTLTRKKGKKTSRDDASKTGSKIPESELATRLQGRDSSLVSSLDRPEDTADYQNAGLKELDTRLSKESDAKQRERGTEESLRVRSIIGRSASEGSESEMSSLDASRSSTFSEVDETEAGQRKVPHFVKKNHQRSESTSTTHSEREFKTRYKAKSTKHVQRSDSTISYKRESDRSYEIERTFQIERREGEKGFGFRVRGSCPVIVTWVDKDGPADRGGLQVGDVLIEVANVNVMEMSGGDLRTVITPDTCSLLMSVAEDRQALEHLDSGKPLICGYLNKQGGMLKTWRKRWFSLHKDNCLYYYKTKEDTDPLGAVLLTNYTVTKVNDVNRAHCFKLTKFDARTYVFQADCSTAMTEWAEKIHHATNQVHTGDTFLSKSTHNVSLPAMSIKNPCCHGFLTKCGNRRKTWKRRYCVLKDACMYYYLDSNSTTAQGVAHFHGYTVTPGAMGRKLGFTMVPPEPRMRTYYFVADSESCYTRWVSAMERSIARWVRVPDRKSQQQNQQ